MRHIGIVGCGSISRIHAHVISQLNNAELTAAFSRTDERRKAFCKEFDIEGYSDFDQFLRHDPLDMVVLCTPNGTHLDYGMPAADAGKDLIIEKPLEINTNRGRRLIEHCRKMGVQLAVIYQNRFIESVQSMKQKIDDGLIGNIIMVSASIKWYREQSYYNDNPWRGSLELDGGGALINQGIHTVDLLYWLAGPVAAVQAFKGTFTHEGISGEDNLTAALEFENGALGVLQASTSITPAQNRIIEINGTKGTIILDGDHLEVKLNNMPGHDDTDTSKKPNNSKMEALGQSESFTESKSTQKASAGSTSPMAGLKGVDHLLQYRTILDHLEKGMEPVVSGHESLQSLAIVEALYRSADTRKVTAPKEM